MQYAGDDCLFMDRISREADKESGSRCFAYYSWNGFTGDYLKKCLGII